MDEDDLNNLHYVLRAYFVDSDYTFEGVLGQGGNGVTYKIGGYGRQRFALKVCPQDTELLRDADGGEDDGPPEALRQLRSEADWLWKLRDCPHVIRIFNLPGDPLTRDIPCGTVAHGMTTWIFMEYAENGTLDDMIKRTLERDRGYPFQNRILWRFFLCLLRACLEMAFHDLTGVNMTLSARNLSSRTPGNLAHTDLKCANIVAGTMLSGFEPNGREITPILKLIDFGEAREVDEKYKNVLFDLGGFSPEASQINVRDVALVMISLITLMPDSELVFGADISLNVNGQEFIAFCSPLWDRRKVLIAASVDADLIDLVCCCLAKDPKDRPALIDLADHVQQQVQFRDQAFYGEAEWESDGSILTRMSGILADASIDPPVSISRGRHTTEIQSGYS